jgi:two-component system, OmpR family, sensor histidine kinase VicK
MNSAHSTSVDIEEKTEVIYGAENIINDTLERLSAAKESVDNCIDSIAPSMFVVPNHPVTRAFRDLKERGIRLRFNAEITKDNIGYCKELMKICSELRHLDEVKGNFGLVDGIYYRASAKAGKASPPPLLIGTTLRAFVEQQQYFFEMLWKKAIPAKQRMTEIEEGQEREFIETIQDPSEIIGVGYRLVRAAKDEILIIFHTANALLRQEKSGGIDLLVENATTYKTRVKILVPIEDKITHTIQRLEKINGIQIRNIEPTMQTRMTILVVDRTYSLVVELKDDTKDNLEEAIGLATYSNSKSTVLSYVSIFDMLWKQSELREELLIHSMAQKEFINIAAHELRNPIQPILGLSDVLLRSDIFLDSNKNNRIKQKEIVEIIARNARRLQRLTEDILDVTRIDSKTLKPNKKSFVLAETMSEMVQDYSSKIRKNDKNVILSFSSSEELESTSIIADENRIKQVISNLIDNAIKFTQKGEITISIEIDYKHNQIVVKVKDTGKGIDSYILPKLFNKFVTKSDSGGTGLGLYICKGIIEAHQGMIWAENNSEGNHSMDVDRVESEMGNGATFSFSLPFTQS